MASKATLQPKPPAFDQSGIWQGIHTYFIPCTGNRPDRIKAVAASGQSLTLEYPRVKGYTGMDHSHRIVAEMLARKLGWLHSESALIQAGAPANVRGGYVFAVLCANDVSALCTALLASKA